MWDKYACWYKTVVDTKTQSNNEAKDRIAKLEALIDDIEAGRVEFTSERGDLESTISELQTGLEHASDMRDKEHEDFVAATDELRKAVGALEEAVEVLADVNKKGEGLLSVAKFDLRSAYAIGRGLLNDNDRQIMESMLDDPDYINKKATFKMKYGNRSKKCLKVLEDMLKTFKENLEEAEAKEKESKESYEKLKESKEEELDSAQTALTDSSKEGGARDVNKQEAKDEVDDLKAQIEADEGFIEDTQKAYDEKLEGYKERKKLRKGEIAAISEAIAVLNSDDAKDTFNKSFKSQGYLLMQQGRGRNSALARMQAAHQAAAEVRQAGMEGKDSRLAILSLRVLMQQGEQGKFEKVLKAIDKMISKLEEEEKDDEKAKEECEKEREEKTKEAKELSIEIDDATEEIKTLETKIEEQKTEIEEAKAEIKENKADLKEATQQREDQKRFFEANKADDEAAVELIEKTMDVLKNFYDEAGLSLAQSKAVARKQAPEVEAGEAPPPPPDMPSGDYEGGAKESKGIQGILKLIKEDVEKDIEEKEEMEKKAIEEFEKTKEDLEKAIEDGEKRIADAEGVIAESETSIGEQKDIQKEKKKSLEATMKELKSAEPGCDFMVVNFEVRKKSRKAEIKGLKKAKEILEKVDK